MLERTPPHSLEAERAVLGAVLLDNEALAKAQAILGPGDFYHEPHRLIFATMREMASRGEPMPIDLLTLSEALRGKGRLEKAGGVSYLSQLLDATPTAGHVRHYSKIVADKANLRGLRRTALEVLDLVDGDRAHCPDGELLARATDLISKAVPSALEKDEAQPLVRLIPASEFTAPPVSWVLDGLVPAGMVTLLSGRDTIGKTLLALEAARSVLTGQPLLGHWQVDVGPVIAILLDDARPTIKERLVALGIKDHPDLCIAPYDVVDLAGVIGMLAELESKALQRKAKLIVLDSLWHFIPTRTGAANDQGLMRPLMQALVRLAGQTGAAVLLVAHDRKDGTDVAGSHVIRAASKIILRLTLPKGAQPDSDELPDTPDRILRFESNLAYPKTWRLRLEGVGRWTFCGTQKEYRSKELEYEVLDYLQGGGEGTADEIRKALGKKAADVRTILKQLAESGQIQTDEEKTRGRPKIIYRDMAFRPDDPLRPDPPDEKSQGELIEINSVTGLGGFSSHYPIPRG